MKNSKIISGYDETELKFISKIRRILKVMQTENMLTDEYSLDVASYRIINILKEPDFSRLYYICKREYNKKGGRPKRVF